MQGDMRSTGLHTNSHISHSSKPVMCVLVLKRAASNQAAEGEAAMLLGLMKTRGCKEEFTPNPELLKDGKVCPTAIGTP